MAGGGRIAVSCAAYVNKWRSRMLCGACRRRAGLGTGGGKLVI